MWAGHALLESKRGKLQAARAVYAGVLAQHTDLPVGDDSPALAMWADWAMMEWKTRNQARCLEVLICLAHSCVPGESTYRKGIDLGRWAPRCNVSATKACFLGYAQGSKGKPTVVTTAHVCSFTPTFVFRSPSPGSPCRRSFTIKTAVILRSGYFRKTPALAVPGLLNENRRYSS